MGITADEVHDPIEAEITRSLFAALAPLAIMSSLFLVSAVLACLAVNDPVLIGLSVAGALASLVRLGVFLRYRTEVHSKDLTFSRGVVLQRRYAASYIAFAVVLGLFGARLMSLEVAAQILTISLLVGFCAGAAAGVGLRPGIAIPSMCAAIVPTILLVLSRGGTINLATSLTLAAFLLGGCQSVVARHRCAKQELGLRFTFGGLARVDSLTELPNRLALREWFEENVTKRPADRIVAVHCLDLDGFKPVNDRYGHPIGDELLRAVGGRLSKTLRSGDIAARLGGDEFVVIQSALSHEDEAALLAMRLSKAIKAPFRIGDHDIHIATCVGFITSTERTEDLEQLIAMADNALYAAKRSKGCVRRFAREPAHKDQIAA